MVHRGGLDIVKLEYRFMRHTIFATAMATALLIGTGNASPLTPGKPAGAKQAAYVSPTVVIIGAIGLLGIGYALTKLSYSGESATGTSG
jgi:hypothetical protein